jgi:phytoene desaturase
MKKKVTIVGTGLGALSSGLLLLKNDYEVQFLEKNFQPGGRLNQIKKDGFTFDMGPSFFSMSYVFTDFMKKCEVEMPFRFVALDPLYTVHFSGGGSTFHLYKDIKKLAEQFRDIEPEFEAKMERYLAKSGALFHDTFDIVIRNNFDNYLDYFTTLMKVNPVHIPVLMKMFWQHVKEYFDSHEARQIVSLVAFFLGRTPFDTMAIYSLLSYTEFRHDGYHNVEGGMYNIVKGMVSELEKRGATFRYGTEITEVEADGDRLTMVIDKEGNNYISDIFLINADAALFRGRVLKRKKFAEKKLLKMEWTMGYLTFYVGVDCKLPDLNQHNYYIGSNFEEYAHNVLKNPDILQKPYYYVNVVSKHNPDCAPEGCESLFFVCPVPSLQYKSDWSDRDEIVDSILADFSNHIGVDLMPHIVTKTIHTPLEWEKNFNLYMGSGLGLSHRMNQIGGMRPKNFDEQYGNLYYVGASTTPGAGLPMAVISAEMVCERILKA